ncbi:PX domain-containing protein kinase-like protein [Oopsacas minuta]|uniref:PX domain-containing protein kinase-like protein n=1 Tax=Oopsacas minuta TaxID=111878 RepID=A0AAV7JCQ1_9METZ|nr:PX domain-containing protein kinase-like protein [Oopsacas minuta]
MYLCCSFSSDSNTNSILKRYSDFNDLNQKLIIFGITHPLPPKKFFGNMDPSFIQDRQLRLQTFIDHITQDPAIANALIVQSFFDPAHFLERMHEEALEYVSMQLRSEPKWQIVESLKDFGWRQRKHYSLAKSKVDAKISDHILIMVENGPDIALGERELNSALKTLCTIQHPYIYPTTFALPCEVGALILREFNPEGSLKDYIYKVHLVMI